jgi:spore germination protein YaaH
VSDLPPPTPVEVDTTPSVEVEEAQEGLRGRTRLAVFVACGALVAAAVVVLALRLGSHSSPTTSRIDAWAPYWTLDQSLPELSSRAGTLREVSPFWYVATGVASIESDPNAPAAETKAFLKEARRKHVRLVPSVVDGLPSGGMAALLADADQRARHVAALAEFAASGGFAGLDIDYEKFAFADDRATWATTRPNWVAFVTELAERLHRDGRTLTVSAPPVYDAGRTPDSGYWVYDYGAMAKVVDHIRVMAYDYSTSTPGPIAPLDWVRQAIEGTTAASGDANKLVLGVPLYGYNWVSSTTGTCPAGEPSERTGVTARSAPELAALRAAQPQHDANTGEWSFTYDLPLTDGASTCTQHRVVRYIDAEGAADRIRLADDAGFDGAALWALGNEPVELWPQLTAPP